jgi:hypothetical protein
MIILLLFDPRTVQTFVYINMSIVVWVFYMYNVYVFTKTVSMYVFIRYLESITQILSTAYFGLDYRDCV